MTASILHKILTAAGIAGFSMAASLPTALRAQCTAQATACSPCSAQSNPCAAAASNPCAATACNPCAAAACNPCAGSTGYNPCKTRWASP